MSTCWYEKIEKTEDSAILYLVGIDWIEYT